MQSSASLTLRAVRTLTAHFERDRPIPWADTDAPTDHIENLLRSIVGIQITIEGVEAKQKYSQNRPAADQRGVLADFLQRGPGAGALLDQMTAVLKGEGTTS